MWMLSLLITTALLAQQAQVNTENTFTETNTFSKAIRVPFDVGQPAAETCDEAKEEGAIALRSPATAPHNIFVCERDGNSLYSWKKLWMVVPLAQRPVNCSAGDLIFISDATPGQNIHLCVATDKWQPVAGELGGAAPSGGGGALPSGGAANDVLIQPGVWKALSGGGDLCLTIDWASTPAVINFNKACLETQGFFWTGLHRMEIGYLDVKQGEAPQPPAAGYLRLWVDSAGKLRTMNSAGAEAK